MISSVVEWVGCQPRVSLHFLEEAMRMAGSPLRRASSVTLKSMPVTFLAVSMISRTLNPFSLPRLK